MADESKALTVVDKPDPERHLLLTVARAVEQMAHIVGTSDHCEKIKAALSDVDGEAKADVEDSHADEQPE